MKLIQLGTFRGFELGFLKGLLTGVLLILLNRVYIHHVSTFLMVTGYSVLFYVVLGIILGFAAGSIGVLFNGKRQLEKKTRWTVGSVCFLLILVHSGLEYILCWDRWKDYKVESTQGDRIILLFGILLFLIAGFFILQRIIPHFSNSIIDEPVSEIQSGKNAEFTKKLFLRKIGLALGLIFMVWLVFIVSGINFADSNNLPQSNINPNLLKNLSKSLQNNKDSKIILIGWDGADWSVLNPLLKSGKLPNLQRLLDSGAQGYLKTLKPTISPSVWTTIVTGKKPEQHGILNFFMLGNILGTDEILPILPLNQAITTMDYIIFTPLSSMLKTNMILGFWKPIPTNRYFRTCQALWNIVNNVGGKVGVFNFLSTYPPEPVDGFIVAKPLGANVELTEDCVYPKEMYKIAKQEWIENKLVTLRELQQFYLNPADAEDVVEFHPPYNLLSLLFRDDQITSEILQDYIQQYSPQLSMAYFRGSDVVSHIYWKYFRPDDFWNIPKKDVEKYGHIIPRYYEFLDEELGKIISAAGPNSTFILCSDHGFRSDSALLEYLHRWKGKKGSGDHRGGPQGILVISGPNVIPRSIVQNTDVEDITPTILWLMNFPVGKDMTGEPITSIFTDSYRSSRPVTYIETYETKPGIRLKSLPTGPALDKKTEEELRSLGYIQ